MRAAGPGAADRAGRDTGAGTVLVISLMAVACLLIGFIGAVAQVVAGTHQAQAAADLAALAGAAAAGGSTASSGCAVAAGVAALNGARLEACTQGAGVVSVQVSAPAGPAGRARAKARAGPSQSG